MTLDNIFEEINKAESIAILTHENPDGDAVGSGLALYHALKTYGKNPDLIIPEHSRTFDFLPGIDEIKTESKIDEIIPIVNIDAKINLSDINKDMVASLKQLEPFGEANKMPIFAFKNLKIDSIRALSEGKHLKLTLKDNNNIINAIGFNMGYLVDEYRIGDKIDVAGVLEVNTFNGVDNLQINMKDIMKSI